MNIDGGYRKFCLIFMPFANIFLLDLPRHFRGNNRRSFQLLDRLILHLSRNSGRSDLSVLTRARDIQLVRSSYSQDDLATSDLPSYFTITARCASQLCLFILPLPWSRINTYTYQRWFIKSQLDRSVDWRARPMIARSHGLLLLLGTINLMGILPAVVHPCQTVINVSKDRYLLWSRCSSLPLVRSLAVFFPLAFPFFSPSYVCVGKGPEPFLPSCAFCIPSSLSPPSLFLFIAEPSPSLSFSAPS